VWNRGGAIPTEAGKGGEEEKDGGSAATPSDVLSNHSAVVSPVVKDN